ncbi:MAG TPA: glycoside hydrolase family 92 protein [Deltaproteobacteria bacterium]|nr:glycoside hydrolase family 92 protein [Deltaproteobacteria bacterium]
MPISLLLAACTEAQLSTPTAWEPYDPLPLVDPLVGTGGVGAQTTGLNPGASWPNGMTLVGPDTRDSVLGAPSFYHFGGYHHDDDRIVAFSHTHSHGMGTNDFGGVSLMPRASFSGAYTTGIGRMAPLDHELEIASPGRYEITLPDDGTRVQIAATLHGAHHRYTFTGGGEPVVLLDLAHALPNVTIGEESWVEVDLQEAEIRGFQLLQGSYSSRFGGLQTHFLATLDPPPVASGGWSDPAQPEPGATSGSGSSGGVWVVFPEGTTQVDVRVALSYVDAEGARSNHRAELPDTALDARLEEVAGAWRERLSRVRVYGDPVDRARLHTAHYHAMLMPSRLDDVDGRYRGLDGEIHSTDHPYYSDLSLWDTFRTLHPWYALVHPELQLDVVRSLVKMADDGGSLPRWPLGHGYTGGMIGSPASIVLAETSLKGLDDWPVQEGFEAAWRHATGPVARSSRAGIEDYLELGYVPAEVSRGTSRTLEFALADAAVARWADQLQRDDRAETLWRQAESWRNVWDPEVGFFQDRFRDGGFTPFEGELVWSPDYVEGNAWHYLWAIPHDPRGLIDVQHGGALEALHERYAAYWDRVRSEPDDLFPDDWYWHGNEPVLHYAWLGSLVGRPDLTAAAARWILANRYSLDPEGLDGNDDSGTLSAWYLWSALGLYPIAGTTQYAIGSPLFEHAEIDTLSGTLSLDAPGTSPQRLYPEALLVDGQLRRDPWLRHTDLLGHHLVFELGEDPVAWGGIATP